MENRLPPLTFRPRPSRQLRWLLAGLQGLTLTVLLFAPVPLAIRMPLLLLLVAQVVYSQRRLSGEHRQAITQVRLYEPADARLLFADGRSMATRLRGDSLLLPWLIVLRFEGEGFLRRPSLLLGRDSLTDEEMRRLRVRLRFAQLQAPRELRSGDQ